MSEQQIDDKVREQIQKTRLIQKIRLIVFDCDGVLTDGGITVLPDGQESKRFDVRDGLGINLAIRAGLKTAIITGRESSVVEHRAKDLGIHHIYQKSPDKTADLNSILQKESLSLAETAFVGDDLPDLAVMRRVGFAVAVGDAIPEVKLTADYVTSLPGGRGAVREAIELILRTQGKWESAIEHYTR